MADKPKPVDAMPQLHKELRTLAGMNRLTSAVDDVDKLIQLLTTAREQVASAPDPHTSSLTITKLQNPIKEGFERINEDLRQVSKVQKKLERALDKSFPVIDIPTDHDAMDDQTALINRAIAMHLLREGQFSVASTFISEAQAATPSQIRPGRDRWQRLRRRRGYQEEEGEEEGEEEDGEDEEGEEGTGMAIDAASDSGASQTGHGGGGPRRRAPRPGDDLGVSLQSQELQAKFANMYTILQALKQQDLLPARMWARENTQELERRGSNLEFELCKLQYIHLFRAPASRGGGPMVAHHFALGSMGRFRDRHLKEMQRLAAALVFAPNLVDSPYASLFAGPEAAAFDEVSASFTREFCSLLGLSAESPLYVAATAGAVALPRLVKYVNAAKQHGAEWTTAHELAFETPLPRSFMYHSVFVCPVSKEQTTAANPPMMLRCGHVLARESLQNLAKGSRFKCPYCPTESSVKEARVVVL